MKKPSRTHVKQSSRPETRKRRATAPTDNARKNDRHAPAKNRGSTPVSTVTKDKPDTTPSHTGEVRNLKVTLITDDRGSQAYLFEANGKRIAIPADSLLEDRISAYRRIQNELGILLTSASAKRELEALISEARVIDNIIAVSRPGPDCRVGSSDQPEYFGYGDGNILTIPAAVDCVRAYPTNGKFQSRGDAALYIDTVARIVRDQAAPLFVLFFGLAPILLPSCRKAGLMVENAFLELTGPSSTNKSTLAVQMAGSLWGGGSNTKLGFANSWNTTANRIEELAVEHQGSLLILDEATAAERSGKERGETILNTVHRLSLGQTRGRMGECEEDFQLLVLSTSNEAITHILQVADAVVGALEVRIITMSCPKRATGFFDKVPEGYASLEEAMRALRKICDENYGHVARLLIKAVLEWSARDHDGFVDYVRDKMELFLRSIDVDPATASSYELRRAKIFALAYATGRVAFKTKVFDKAQFGKILSPLKRAWFDHGRMTTKPIDAPELAAFLADTGKTIVDITATGKTEMSDKDFAEVDAFIYRERGGDLLMLMTRESMKRNETLALRKARLVSLRERGILKTNEEDKLTVKKSVRSGGGGQPFYAFKLRGMPKL